MLKSQNRNNMFRFFIFKFFSNKYTDLRLFFIREGRACTEINKKPFDVILGLIQLVYKLGIFKVLELQSSNQDLPQLSQEHYPLID